LHINSGDTDALLFFDAGEISHAEYGALFGDEAVIHILQSCMRNNSGIYKFVYGSSSAKHTVLRSATDLMLDAMREMDESAHQSQQNEPSIAGPAGKDSPFTPLLGLADSDQSQESAAIASAIADFAANSQTPDSETAESLPLAEKHGESPALVEAKASEARHVLRTPAESEAPVDRASESSAESGELDGAAANRSSPAEPPFANYSIVPYAGNDMEDIT
jgi:hypothetical protein